MPKLTQRTRGLEQDQVQQANQLILGSISMRLLSLVSLSLCYRVDVIVFTFQPLSHKTLLQPGTFLMFNQRYLAAIT